MATAPQVEKITTQKKSNLILNVDGVTATAFVDMVRTCGAFTKEEAAEAIENGCLNGMFVLGRSIGFIGHYLDQKRLKQVRCVCTHAATLCLHLGWRFRMWSCPPRSSSLTTRVMWMCRVRVVQGLYRHPWDDISYVGLPPSKHARIGCICSCAFKASRDV